MTGGDADDITIFAAVSDRVVMCRLERLSSPGFETEDKRRRVSSLYFNYGEKA